MRYEELVDSVEEELALLAVAVAGGPVTAPVATCDDWTMADLVHHVGEVCGFWSHVLSEGTGRPKASGPPEPGTEDSSERAGPPAPEELAEWLSGFCGALVGELRATPPETEVWTLSPADRTATFVARRCAHELAVHRYDAQSARGTATPIAAPLAADGIDELLCTLLPTRAPSGRASGQTLHLHGTDPGVAAEWLVALGATEVSVDRRHGRGDLALRGAAGDLLLLLYRRPPLGEVERLGDQSVLGTWYEEFVL